MSVDTKSNHGSVVFSTGPYCVVHAVTVWTSVFDQLAVVRAKSVVHVAKKRAIV